MLALIGLPPDLLLAEGGEGAKSKGFTISTRPPPGLGCTLTFTRNWPGAVIAARAAAGRVVSHDTLAPTRLRSVHGTTQGWARW